MTSVDKRKQEFIDTLKYADSLLPQFDNNIVKVCEQLNKEDKRTYQGHVWQKDNLRANLKRLYDGKYGIYHK